MPMLEYDCAMARAATTSDVFNAIAEPQRREIVLLLPAGDRVGTGAGDGRAGGVQTPAGAPGGRAGSGPQGRQAAPVRPRRARAATGPRVDRRVRAVLERELRPAGRVRAGPRAGTAGG